ncbi:MAG: right-handed parallel beta-helix repeat-containing protein [Pyrinomonadaceae bacterium]
MTKLRLGLSPLALIILLAAGASVAQAQATRTWVSGVGNDADPCSRTAPCKTFAGAISKTAAGGEISVLDPGGFGAVTITKSITINGNGQLAGILASLTTGIIVNAGVNDVITIKNVDINGAGNGIRGINFVAGKTLNLKNVWISGFTNEGIQFAPANGGNLVTDEVTIQKCTGSGIRLAATANFSFATINRTHISGMGVDGVKIDSGGRATIRDSILSQNTGNGVTVGTNGGANLESTLVNNNNVGFSQNNPGGTSLLSNVTIINNNTGISNAAGFVVSFGNNRINSNSTNGAPTSNVGQQ